MPDAKSTKPKTKSTNVDTRSIAPSLTDAETKNPEPGIVEDLGLKSAEALSNPIFRKAWEMTLSQIMARWVNSEEGEDDLRKTLWLQAKSLQELENMLEMNVNQLQQQNQTRQEKAEEALSHYENYQGYGLDDVPGFNESH